MRTGVTVVLPHEGDPGHPVFAGCPSPERQRRGDGARVAPRVRDCWTTSDRDHEHALLGVVRDAIRLGRGLTPELRGAGALPVVAETYDGFLNDIDGQHIRAEHVHAALRGDGGPVAEGKSVAAPA